LSIIYNIGIMQPVFFFIIAGVFLCLMRIIGKRWFWGYFLGGLTFGIYNEICFEFCWTYSAALSPMIWRDVPLIVVLGWGLETGLSLTISNRIIDSLRLTNLWLKKLSDVILFFCFGYASEIVMSKFGYWHYNFSMQAYPAIQISGYVFVGILVSCCGRTFQSLLDNKPNGKTCI